MMPLDYWKLQFQCSEFFNLKRNNCRRLECCGMEDRTVVAHGHLPFPALFTLNNYCVSYWFDYLNSQLQSYSQLSSYSTILWVSLYINCANFMGLTVNILWQFYGSYYTNIVKILWVLLYIYCDNFVGLTVHILWQFYGSYYTLWQLYES